MKINTYNFVKWLTVNPVLSLKKYLSQKASENQNSQARVSFSYSHKSLFRETAIALMVSALLAGCGSDSNYDDDDIEVPDDTPVAKQFELVQGSDSNQKSHPLLSLNPGGPGGSPNQSLRAGDVLNGNAQDNLLIGGLGVDLLLGNDGDDILIGGTEDFNANVDADGNGSDNRDRAFGHAGDDVFIWAPGDGSDFFDGGEGTDVIIFGVLGESRDAEGNTEGAPFFAVNPPNGNPGSQDFDGIHLDENNQPQVRVSESPGFCSVVDSAAAQASFETLNIDNVVRFSLRAIADSFDAGERDDDDGLRVAVSIKNTEFLVCTRRELDSDNSANNIGVFDIRNSVPVEAQISDLPEYVQSLIL